MFYNYIVIVGVSVVYKLIIYMNISFLINYIVILMIYVNFKGSDYFEYCNVVIFILV